MENFRIRHIVQLEGTIESPGVHTLFGAGISSTTAWLAAVLTARLALLKHSSHSLTRWPIPLLDYDISCL